MSSLFKPFKIGALEIPNRFMRSATTSYWSDEQGIIRPDIISLYRKLSKGQVGLIVKGHLYISKQGKAHEGQAGICSDEHILKLRELTKVVHDYECKIIAQLNHAGIYSIVDRAGPSEYISEGWRARALSSDEIYEIVESFGDAVDKTMASGFDGIQIHGAHGYLISQFLSKLANRRNDQWGGNLENRMRFLVEIYDEIKTRVRSNVPIMLKMNCDDFSWNGFTIEESVKVAEAICNKGLSLLEISGGGVGRQNKLRKKAQSHDNELVEATFAGHATKIRAATRTTPMALVNGIRSQKCMDALINKDIADIISMSRPFIREPDLVKKLKNGQPEATCNSCDACISDEVFSKMMLRCHLD